MYLYKYMYSKYSGISDIHIYYIYTYTYTYEYTYICFCEFIHLPTYIHTFIETFERKTTKSE